MKKPIFRVKKGRHDQLVAELAKEISKPDSCPRELSAEKMVAAFTQMAFGALQDYHEQLAETDAPAENYYERDEMAQRSRDQGRCAWEHFRLQAQTRFHLALIELMHESFAFADAIYVERTGGSPAEIAEALPLREEIEHNVLRHAVIRLNQLPIQRPENAWHIFEPGDEKLPAEFQIARLIFKDMALWTYDHAAVTLTLQQIILGFVQKHEHPVGEAKFYAQETADLIYEHIDGAIQVMLLILANWSLMLSKHSAVKRHEIEIAPKEARGIQPSKEQLKEFANALISSWVDELSFDWRGRGRTVKKTREIEAEREQLIQELRRIAAALMAEGEKITWEALAMRRKRPPNNLQGGEALRKEAKRLKLSLREFNPDKN